MAASNYNIVSNTNALAIDIVVTIEMVYKLVYLANLQAALSTTVVGDAAYKLAK